MNSTLARSIIATVLLAGSSLVIAADDADMDRSHPKAYVKDSVITTKIKAKLATDHFMSLTRIHVDTDEAGVVWLTGTAKSQEAADEAVNMARSTEHVTSVHSDIRIEP